MTKRKAKGKEDADTETGDPFRVLGAFRKHRGRVWRKLRDGVNRIPALAPRLVLSSRRTCSAYGVQIAQIQNRNDIARSVRGADLPRRIAAQNM